MSQGISRREALAGSIGMMMAGGAVSASAAATARLDLEDRAARPRIMAKVKGTLGDEVAYTFCRLHLYLWLNGGNLKPMLTMQNLNASTWRKLPNGNYAGTIYEVGVYTRFDTDEVVEEWENPVTGDKRKIWQFVGGPLSVQFGPDGIVTGPEATLKPKEMRMDVLGDTLIVPSQSAFSFPNPFTADKWPKEAGEPVYYWDSHYMHATSVAAVLDPGVASAPGAVQFQNLVSFHPWLGMGKTPGRTYGKALGAKLRSLDELPGPVRSALERKTPEIFDLKSWTKPRNDFAEYMMERGPAR